MNPVSNRRVFVDSRISKYCKDQSTNITLDNARHKLVMNKKTSLRHLMTTQNFPGFHGFQPPLVCAGHYALNLCPQLGHIQ